MSVDIRLKHSSQAGKVPTAGDAKSGEILLNTADVKAYIKDASGNIVQLAGNDLPANDDRYVQKDGDTMGGQLTLPGGGTGSQAITVDEVDTAIGAIDDYVEKAGDTMTGQLTLPGGGTGSEAITVDEVDTAIAAIDDYVEKAGDTMTGQLTLPGGGTGSEAITVAAAHGP